MDRTSGKTPVLLLVAFVAVQFIALEFRYLMKRIFVPEPDVDLEPDPDQRERK